MKETAISCLWILAFICVSIYFCGIHVDSTNNWSAKGLEVKFDDGIRQVKSTPDVGKHVGGRKRDYRQAYNASELAKVTNEYQLTNSKFTFEAENVTDIPLSRTYDRGTTADYYEANLDQTVELTNNGSNSETMDNVVDCDPNRHITLSTNMTTGITLKTYENNPCHVFVSSPPGVQIGINVRTTQSNWSTDSYFFVLSNDTQATCFNDIIELRGPCSITFTSSSLEVYTKLSATVQLLPIGDSSQPVKKSDPTKCITQQIGRDDVNPYVCQYLDTNFTQVFNVNYSSIEQYQQLAYDHPSLTLTFAGEYLPEIQLPLLDLSYADIYVAEYPLCPIECTCSLHLNQFTTECFDTKDNEETLLIFPQSYDLQVNTSALNGSRRQLVHISPGGFRNLNNLDILLLDLNLISILYQDTFEGLSRLQVLDLSFNNLIHINSCAFSGLDTLKQLFLNRNKLIGLTANMFEGLHIQVLYLIENQIMTIDPNISVNLNSLQVLSLTGNTLSILGPTPFHDMSSLIYLDLSYNSIEDIDTDTFRNLKNMTHLSLLGNQLSTFHTFISNNVRDLGYLTALYLNDNKLTNLHVDIFHGLVSLAGLWLHDNALTNLDPGLFRDLFHLKHLTLYDNQLSYLHVDIFQGLASLSELLMHNNILTALEPGIFRDLTQLTQLGLNGNQLSNLHVDIFHNLFNLNVLALDNNQLTTLDPSIIRNLGELREISLWSNHLSNLDIYLFQGLGNLFELGLNDNVLTTLPPGIFENLANLSRLYLNDNYLSNLHMDLFHGLVSLTTLQLHNNKLTTLKPGVFRDLAKLEQLLLSGNNLSDLHVDLFQGLVNLLSLGVHNNRLSTLEPGSFRGLGNLIHLYLDDNNLSNLHIDVFQGLGNLSILWLTNNSLTTLQPGIFRGLAELTQLVLSGNHLSNLHVNLFQGLVNLSTLGVHTNRLSTLEPGSFRDLGNLIHLYLDGNNLSNLHNDVFQGLGNLLKLLLTNNKLTTLQPGIFHGLIHLSELWLDNNTLTTSSLMSLKNCCVQLQVLILNSNMISIIGPNSFSGLHNLIVLELVDNQITAIHPTAFSNVTGMKYIILQGNALDRTTPDSFSWFNNTTTIVVDTPGICCQIDSNTGPECISLTLKSEYMTCEQLLPNTLLKYSVWIISVMALIANMYVLIRGCLTLKRGKDSKDPKKQVLFIVNLAAADFLMGAYMLIIGSADRYYGQYFPIQADYWKTHELCKLAGFLSVLSSEASLFFITLIGIDRFWAFRKPGISRKLFLRTKSKVIVTALIWAIALVASALAIGLETDDQLYQFSEVCIGLPLARRFITEIRMENITITYNNIDREDDFVPSNTYEILGSKLGSIYSIILFLGVNLICCVIVSMCYICLFIQLFRANVSTFRSGIKMALITITDLMCWLPIIVLGIMIQSEVTEISPIVFAWVMCFVLPINSVLNPLLYTIMGSCWCDCFIRKGTINGRNFVMLDETRL